MEMISFLPEFDQGTIDDALELIQILIEELYGRPSVPGEIESQAERLALEAIIPGRTIEFAPLIIVEEGEDVELDGTFITPVLFNEGLIFDNNRVGDNLLTGAFFNEGLVDFKGGQDFVVGATGGIGNDRTGVISTGGQLDLISGATSGVQSNNGILNLGLIDSGNGKDRIVGNAIGVIDAEGIKNTEGGLIETGRGDDLIDGEAAAALGLISGIDNEFDSTISTGLGNDIVRGVADDLTGLLDLADIIGIGNQTGSTINTGDGDDLIEGIAKADNSLEAFVFVNGVANSFASISLGDGSDKLIGEAISVGDQFATGISNFFDSIIDLGTGDDFVFGLAATEEAGEGGFTIGIELVESTIVSKEGNNSIVGEASGGLFNDGINLDGLSTIELGNGNDTVDGLAFGGEVDSGIFNEGIIKLGRGNDKIIGTALGGDDQDDGIFNDGKIRLGRGNDVIESIVGGFGGGGTTNLGRGNDLILGFGSGKFNGGRGTDTIKLTTGIYEFEAGFLFSDGVVMGLRSVERIAGLNDDQSLLLQSSTFYVVDENNMIGLA